LPQVRPVRLIAIWPTNWLVSRSMTQPFEPAQARSILRRNPLRVFNQVSLLSAMTLALVIGFRSFADADIPERYPYDPVCPWGRVADGNGMMVRCLQQNEAHQLLQVQRQVQGQGQGASEPPQVRPAAPVSPPPNGATPPERPLPPTRAGSVIVESVGPAVADAGDLPVAGKQLSAASAKDKYVQCVNQHGGLTAKQAKVVVRFLVRERGRAEGVGVKSHSGLSLAAAQCIADVVNLRYVGYPAAPIVGATIPIVLSSQP
jgi:hypothetical protein